MTDLALNIFVYDRKTGAIRDAQEYVVVDLSFFTQKIESGEIVPSTEEEKALIAPRLRKG